ncbi:MAG: LacI family DNA-binding transcriptional regulator [Bacteroidota bacterium]
MAVTIYDIAEQAGVSIATVSRVFSGRARVADATRERVFAVAEALNYEPNVSARSLARQSTRVVSAVVPMLTSYFFMEVIRGVQDRLSEIDYDLLVYASRSPEEVDGQLARAMQKGRADGLLLCSTPIDGERALSLQASQLPVVLVDSVHAQFDSVSVDNHAGGYEATQHLLGRGHTRVAMIAPNPMSVPGVARRRGYEAALADAGLGLDPALVVSSEDTEQHGYTREAGYAAMQRLLALPSPPEAVFAASDVQALGALRAARDAGLRVPDDLAMIGFDDIRTSAYVGLSTLSQPMYDMGKIAIDKLIERIGAPDNPVSHTTFSARLIRRETSGHVDAPRPPTAPATARPDPTVPAS